MVLKADVKTISEKAIKDEKIISELLEGILSKKDEVRFISHKVLMNISEMYPDILYPKWDYFAGLLDSDNHYHRYIAINLLANLVKVDTKNKFEKIFDRYFINIECDRTMVAGQATLNSGKIAKAKPNLQTKITDKLLNIDKIHKGKHTELMKAYAIEAFGEYYEDVKDGEKILNFIKDQLGSNSPKTKKIAKEFLNKWGKNSI